MHHHDFRTGNTQSGQLASERPVGQGVGDGLPVLQGDELPGELPLELDVVAGRKVVLHAPSISPPEGEGYTFPNTMLALWPPNPKELETAARILRSRGAPGT